MKIIKKTGIILVLLSLTLLVSLLITGHYQLNRRIIDSTDMTEDQKVAFDLSASHMIGKTYQSKINFLDELNESFDKANDLISGTYRVSQKEIDRLAAMFRDQQEIQYVTDSVAGLYAKQNRLNSSKIKGIKDYTGWMQDRTYTDFENFKQQLTESVEKYNNSLLQSQGFTGHKIKSLKFRMIKASYLGWAESFPLIMLLLTFGLLSLGTLMYVLPKFRQGEPGIKNDNLNKNSLTARGWSGILVGILLITFYVLLYWFAYWIAEWAVLLDPLSQWITGRPADQWFFYGFVYTWSILFPGIHFLTKYRHSRLHQVRTYSVMFFQLVFAFTLPMLLYVLNLPEVDLKNIWPLNYNFFFEWKIDEYLEAGTLGLFLFGWGIALIIPGVPLLTYFLGKRWYCSWVCGCGGLAETAGDPFRHLSDKRLVAWRIERILVHSVLVFAVVMTGWVLYTFFTGKNTLLGVDSFKMRQVYGFLIGAMFAGVAGVGFYPFFGSRVWCRFGCPLAAYLGIVQRFKSRFRITTNGGQCMSCGNCSTYCEMGIDVRAYAQKGQNIIRASCVGCGVCASVCPRGVLRLENKKEKGRFNKPVLLGNDGYLNNRK